MKLASRCSECVLCLRILVDQDDQSGIEHTFKYSHTCRHMSAEISNHTEASNHTTHVATNTVISSKCRNQHQIQTIGLLEL